MSRSTISPSNRNRKVTKRTSKANMKFTIRQAIDKGHELSPDLLSRLGQPKDPKHGDLRRGVIFGAAGVAIAIFGVILGEEDAVRPLIGIATFPFLIGVAYLGLWRFSTYPD